MVFGSSVYFLGEGRKHSATGAWVRVEFLELGVERGASLVPQMVKKKQICLRCRRPRFDSWVGKTPWRRKWQPAPVFLPGESHGQRNPAGYSPWGCKETDTTNAFNTFRGARTALGEEGLKPKDRKR